MVWKISFDKSAEKELRKLDLQIASRILDFLNDRVLHLDDPRSIGKTLKGGKLREYWKYRVGDYRIITKIEDETVQILVIKIGNRLDVYKK